MTDRVLVTGLSGFIGAHVTARLLGMGYEVRGAVRDIAKAKQILSKLQDAGFDTETVKLREVDLGNDAGWPEAVADCRYIIHTASPFPGEEPNDREALVPEARVGTQRVLEHGFSARAERIVMTSSMLAMTGRKRRGKSITVNENDWTDPEWKGLSAYGVSKTRAELSAWSYVKSQNLESRFVTVCPGFVLGPDRFDNGGTSIRLMQDMMNGEYGRVPHIAPVVIDVRDCAAIHVAAMKNERAAGRRLIAASEAVWLLDIVKTIKAEFPELKDLPRGYLPSLLVRMLSVFNDQMKLLTPDLDVWRVPENTYVTNITQVIPRPSKEAIVQTAKSLIDNGHVGYIAI